MKIINKSEKKEIEKKLEKYGIEKLPYLLIQTGKEKIRGFSGSLSREEIQQFNKIQRIEIIGIYLMKIQNNEARLSLDACHLLNPKENIIELTDEQAEEYMKGKDLDIKEINTQGKYGYVILKNKDNILGTGKISQNKLSNFIPKERRIRN